MADNLDTGDQVQELLTGTNSQQDNNSNDQTLSNPGEQITGNKSE